MPCDIKITTENIELKDMYILKKVCEKLGYTIEGNVIYVNRYGSIIITEKNIAFNSNIRSEVNKLKAYYGLEKAKMEARKLGRTSHESIDQNGNLILKVYV